MAPLEPMASSRSPISALTIASLTSSPASITAFALRPTGVPWATAARSMSPVESWTIPRVSSRRAACVPFPAPGGPSRMMFICRTPTTKRLSATPALELSLLDQVSIFMRDEVALDLSHRVHRHVDDDEQAGAAEAERDARLRKQEFGDQ